MTNRILIKREGKIKNYFFIKQKGFKKFMIGDKGLLCPKCNKPTYRYIVSWTEDPIKDNLCNSCKEKREAVDNIVKNFQQLMKHYYASMAKLFINLTKNLK